MNTEEKHVTDYCEVVFTDSRNLETREENFSIKLRIMHLKNWTVQRGNRWPGIAFNGDFQIIDNNTLRQR